MVTEQKRELLTRRFFQMLRVARGLKKRRASKWERRLFFLGWLQGRLDAYEEIQFRLKEVGSGQQN